DSVSNLAGELYDSNGAAKEMADTMMDNLNGALTELSSAFEGVQIAIGTALIPAIQAVSEWLKSLADWFNNLDEPTQRSIAIFMALTSVFLIVGGGMMLLVGFLPNLIAGFTAVKTVATALTTAIAGISLPMLATIAVIGLVVAAIVHLWRTNEEFRATLTSLWENIKTLIAGVWEAIQPGAMAFMQILGILIGVIGALIGWVVNVVAAIVEWIVAFIEANSWIMQTIQIIGMIVGVIAGLIAVFMVVAKIIAVVVTVIKVLAAIFVFLTSPIGIVIAIIGLLVAAVVFLGDKFEWLGNIVDSEGTFMSYAWDKFRGFFGKGTSEAADEAEGAIEGVAESGSENLNELEQSGTESVEGLNTSVTENTADMAENATFDIEGMSADGLDSFGDLADGGIDMSALMNDGVTSEVGDMADL